jgi:hypothetical protein
MSLTPRLSRANQDTLARDGSAAGRLRRAGVCASEIRHRWTDGLEPSQALGVEVDPRGPEEAGHRVVKATIITTRHQVNDSAIVRCRFAILR